MPQPAADILSRFHRSLWLAGAALVLYGFSLTAYVNAEKRIEQAHERRLYAYQLAVELRVSSYELTRMARSYVVTGDPAYKHRHQEILDIRDGRAPRRGTLGTGHVTTPQEPGSQPPAGGPCPCWS